MGIIGSVVGGLTSAVGSLHQTDAEMQSADYQERQAVFNSRLAWAAGSAAVSDIRAQTAQTVGTQAARTKAGGVTLEGSPLQVMADTAAQGELKAQRTWYAANVVARALQTYGMILADAGSLTFTARVSRSGGRCAMIPRPAAV